MRKVALLLFALLATLGFAQDTLRVLVLPFDANRSFEPYGLGLATGLQRTLNSLDGVYAPPVAEAGLFVTRAFEAGLEAVETATAAFEVDAVISGAVSGSGSGIDVTLAFAGPTFTEPKQVRLQLPNDPVAAVEAVSLATLTELELETAEARSRVASLAQETPELTSLGAVSRASSRLGTSLSELTAAADLNPESSWALSEKARALALAGRHDEALASAGAAVEANQDDVTAKVVRGIVASVAGDDELARRSFEEALALNSHHALALVGLAEQAEEQAEVRSLLERAVEASPRQLEAVLGLAELESSPQRALQVLRRASENLPESVALHRAFVERAIEAGDPAGALAYLRQVTSEPLSTSPALFAQATALPSDMTEQALALVMAGRERFPESSGLKLTEAELQRQAGREEEAVSLLEELREQFPDSVEVANSLAITLAQMGEVERAREVFTSVAQESPTVQLNLGRLLLQAGQARAAIATLEPLLESRPDDSELHALYGIALGRTGHIDDGLASLERALELDPDNEAARRAMSLLEQQRQIVGDDAIAFEGEAASEFQRGLYALESDDPGTAARAFARAFELSGHPLAAFYHGYSLHRSGEIRQALEPYEVALEAYPESDTVLNNLGYAQLQLGRFDLALQTLSRAVEANSENTSAHINLGLTYYGLGRFDDALEQWEQAIAIDPSLEDDLAQIRERARAGQGPN
ncbi:MAG TPA: tetratricopeptide repeat protein [Trueperaceae bacterium]